MTPAHADQFALRLYVAGQTPKAVRAFANLRRICEEHLAGRYSIEVIDLVELLKKSLGAKVGNAAIAPVATKASGKKAAGKKPNAGKAPSRRRA